MTERRLGRLIVRRLFVMLALIGTGCAPGGDLLTKGRHPYTHPHELRFAAGVDIQHLNPLLGASGYEIALDTLCMAYLTKQKTSLGDLEPELAVVMPTERNGGVSADGRTITWHLRHDAKWSDGVPFDAGDVMFTTKQILNRENQVADLKGWELIERIDEPNRYTVVYRLKKRFPDFATTFFSTAGSAIAILPRHLLHGLRTLNTAPYNALPVGIGPFKFASWKRADSVVMVRDPNYFRGSTKLDRVVFKILPDQNSMYAQFRTHDFDLWLSVPPHIFQRATAIAGIQGSAMPSRTYDHLDFNLTNPILRDVRVRRALRYATDRAKLIRVSSPGLSSLNESPLTPACRFYLRLPPVPFDLAKAGALLDSAGWQRLPDGGRAKGGRRLVLTFAEPSGQPELDTALELLRDWWKRAGVELDVQRYLAPQFFANAAEGGVLSTGRFDVTRFAWALGADEDLSDMYACDRFQPNGQNDLRWCDPAATAAMNRALSTSDPATRRRENEIVQRIVYDQVPTIVLDARKRLSAYSTDITNWNPEAAPFDNIMNVDI